MRQREAQRRLDEAPGVALAHQDGEALRAADIGGVVRAGSDGVDGRRGHKPRLPQGRVEPGRRRRVGEQVDILGRPRYTPRRHRQRADQGMGDPSPLEDLDDPLEDLLERGVTRHGRRGVRAAETRRRRANEDTRRARRNRSPGLIPA